MYYEEICQQAESHVSLICQHHFSLTGTMMNEITLCVLQLSLARLCLNGCVVGSIGKVEHRYRGHACISRGCRE